MQLLKFYFSIFERWRMEIPIERGENSILASVDVSAADGCVARQIIPCTQLAYKRKKYGWDGHMWLGKFQKFR